MDKLESYRSAIKEFMSKFVELANNGPSDGTETLCAFDEQRDHYLVLNTGWAGNRRNHGTTLFARICNGKIWIEEDWTENGITSHLEPVAELTCWSMFSARKQLVYEEDVV